MHTLTKKQHNIYKKLCDQYNKSYYNLCSFDSYLRGQVNKAYENIKGYDKTLEYYEDIKAVKIYAENDY
jgi:hypothetical protein